MKSIFKLISVGLSIFLLGSCYQKARNVDPNNPNLYDPSNPVSPMQETWDWVGNPPFSVDMDGTPYSKTINNADFTTHFGNPVIWVKTFDGDDFQIQLPEDPVAGEKYSIKGKMSYDPAQGTPSGKYGYLCFGGFVKIINISETEIEALFYSTMGNHVDPDVKLTKGYFKVSKRP